MATLSDAEILRQMTDAQALTCTMIGEAVGDARDGSSVEERIAVGCVVRNRAREPLKYGDSLKDVCLRRWQFSCWNVGDPNRKRLLAVAYRLVTGQPMMDALVEETFYLAQGIKNGYLTDRVKGANHYLTAALLAKAPPRWAQGRTPVARVGSHVFFRL